jgi:hypothetical protein
LQLKQNEKYKELNNTTNANGSSSSNWQITNADIFLEEKKRYLFMESIAAATLSRR